VPPAGRPLPFFSDVVTIGRNKKSFLILRQHFFKN
jgi:hypothetical protein